MGDLDRSPGAPGYRDCDSWVAGNSNQAIGTVVDIGTAGRGGTDMAAGSVDTLVGRSEPRHSEMISRRSSRGVLGR